MESKLLVVLLLVLFMSEINFVDSSNDKTTLSRRKRYVVFPEGSTLSVAICLTTQTILRPSEIFSEGINWGISYDLPNSTSTVQEFLYPRHVMQRRHRRDLYQKMEVIMDSMGYNGRSCIFRALCEAGRMFSNNGENIIEKILQIIFKFPQQNLLQIEPEEHRLYHFAHRMGKEKENQECAEMFTGCSFSLLDLALGYYSDYLPT